MHSASWGNYILQNIEYRHSHFESLFRAGFADVLELSSLSALWAKNFGEEIGFSLARDKTDLVRLRIWTGYLPPPGAIEIFMLPFATRFHPLATMVGQVAMINSFLAGVFASILAAGLLSVSLLPVILIGLIVLVLVLGLHLRYSAGLGPTVQQSMQIRFPTPDK